MLQQPIAHVDGSVTVTVADRPAGHVQVPKTALQAPWRGGKLQPVALQVVRLAADGLRRRGRGEEQYLEPLLEIVTSGVTLAEKMLALYHSAWGGKLDPLYDGSYDY